MKTIHQVRNDEKVIIHKTHYFKHFKFLLAIIALTTLCGVCYSGSFKEQILSEKINEADLIIKATLLRKYSKMENIVEYVTNGKEIIGEIPSSIYTTFVFQIDEVLKGIYGEDIVEVKMLGGCDDKNCEQWSIGYDYEINENAVLFLSLDKKNKIYRSTQASSTVFNLKSSGELVSKSQHSKNSSTNYLVPDKNGKMKLLPKLTIVLLKSHIKNGKKK